jgi:hypothetical protein
MFTDPRWQPHAHSPSGTGHKTDTADPGVVGFCRLTGTYGDYLLGKVSTVFPPLRRDVLE